MFATERKTATSRERKWGKRLPRSISTIPWRQASLCRAVFCIHLHFFSSSDDSLFASALRFCSRPQHARCAGFCGGGGEGAWLEGYSRSTRSDAGADGDYLQATGGKSKRSRFKNHGEKEYC